MKTKKEITENWLPRYTGVPTENFGKYILLTNFQGYLDSSAPIGNTEVVDRKWPCPQLRFNGYHHDQLSEWEAPMQPP